MSDDSTKIRALIIGVEDYKHSSEISPLRCATSDAVAVTNSLVHLLGWKREWITLMAEAEGGIRPTLEEIRDHLNMIRETNWNAGDTFFFFYSGHGLNVGDRESLLPINASISTPVNAATTTIAVKTLTDTLNHPSLNGVQRILWFDCCRNKVEAGLTAKGLAPEGNPLTEQLIRDICYEKSGESSAFEAGPTSYFFACQPNYRAYENVEARHGFFCHAVLEVLRGGSWPSVGIKHDDLAKRVNEKMQELKGLPTWQNIEQSPHCVVPEGNSPVVPVFPERVTKPRSSERRRTQSGSKIYMKPVPGIPGLFRTDDERGAKPFIYVPEGIYTLGEKDRVWEGPEIQLHIPAFYIEAYPVLTRDVVKFLEDGKAEDFLRKLQAREGIPLSSHLNLEDLHNRLLEQEHDGSFVTSMTYLEARVIADAFDMRLPFEFELEVALRAKHRVNEEVRSPLPDQKRVKPEIMNIINGLELDLEKYHGFSMCGCYYRTAGLREMSSSRWTDNYAYYVGQESWRMKEPKYSELVNKNCPNLTQRYRVVSAIHRRSWDPQTHRRDLGFRRVVQADKVINWE